MLFKENNKTALPRLHASPNKTKQYKTKQNKTPIVNVTKPYGRQLHDPSPKAISLPITSGLLKYSVPSNVP